MDHSRFSDNTTLLDFLNQNGIPAIPSSNADPGMLHWWEFEKIERITDAAIFEGYFFLVVTEPGFSLHVFDAQNDWYNYVRVWKADIDEAQFILDLKSILFADDIYSFDSYVWFCVRETYFYFEWQRTTADIQSFDQITLELKSGIFKIQESLAKSPNPNKVKESVVNVLRLFAQYDSINPVHFLIMQRYFPPLKYEKWMLPAEIKSLLYEVGEVFSEADLPNRKLLEDLVQKAEVLHNIDNISA